MNAEKSNHPRARFRSIGFAVQGLRQLVMREPNAQIHLIATIAVIAAGMIRNIGRHDWGLIVIAIALVWVAEAFNTAIETLCDLWCKGTYHPKIKIIKDISAAAVLIAAMASVAIAVSVFLF